MILSRSLPLTSMTIWPSAMIGVSVAELKRLRHVLVRNHKAGYMAFLDDALCQLKHLFRRRGVERRRVLIEQQELGRNHRRHQQRQRLPLAARQQADRLPHTILKPHIQQRQLRAEFFLISAGYAAERVSVRGAQIREREVFFYRHVRRGAAERVLKQPPDNAAALMLRGEGDVTSRKRYAAGIGIEAARDRVEERGFSRAVRADYRCEVAPLKMQRKVGQRAFFIRRCRG